MFSEGDLYRNVGVSTGLARALLARDGAERFHQLSNKYNDGSGFDSQAEFIAGIAKSQAAGVRLREIFGP
jgi:hypothetical protein